MQYLGGKHRIAKELCGFINPLLSRFEYYIEPFVGGANIVSKIKHPKRIAMDANAALITLYQALQNGWEPPDTLSEVEYAELKANQASQNPLTAFAGFGCSFGGKWFGGYARNAIGHNYALSAKNSIRKKFKTLEDVKFIAGGYDTFTYPKSSLIYCDPPYANTTGYDGVKEAFDSSAFWEWCRQQTRNGNLVLVSEYAAPEDFMSVVTIETKTDMRDKTGGKSARREELWTYVG